MSDHFDSDQQLKAWQEFVDRRVILPNVNHVVANSWRRCLLRVAPYKDTPIKCLSTDHLLAAQVTSFDLFSIARPVMEDIHQHIEYSGSMVILANSAGFILELLGDEDMLDFARTLDIVQGAAVSEPEMGTNALALALLERIPVRVVGAEHYLHRYHQLAGAAAPIFEPGGHLLGAIGLFTFLDHFHPHSLGTVVAGSNAIEGQIKSDQLLAEHHSQLAQLNTIIKASSEGIMVWNSDHTLMHINPAAAQMIGIPDNLVVGRRLGEVVSYPKFVLNAIKRGDPLTDVETDLMVEGRPVGCVLSLRFIQQRKQLHWIIATMRREKDVRQLVHSQVGAQAALTIKDIPGTSNAIKRVRRFVRSAAQATAPILIRGEVGTGKSPLANAIHNESPYREGPFLIFACSSIPSELAMVELVGYEEGTSAKVPGGRPSKFELARSGTLYFQDVEALPLESQGILLNAVDLGIVQRLGSNKPIDVDVRIIAASSASLEELISKGSIRSDLFFRLSSFEITIPPLRERKNDLPILSDRIIRRLSVQLNRQLSLDPEVQEVLKAYSWPGNIRELEAVLARASVQAGFSGVISVEHLPDYVKYPKINAADPQNIKMIQPLSEIERQAILQTARLCGGNVSEMARVLGVGRTTIWRKMKDLDVSPEEFRRQRGQNTAV